MCTELYEIMNVLIEQVIVFSALLLVLIPTLMTNNQDNHQLFQDGSPKDPNYFTDKAHYITFLKHRK